MDTPVKHYGDYVDASPDKFYKTTLFDGDHLMLGLNCLEPGQAQSVHEHAGQDKFYLVLEGVGVFSVGAGTHDAGAGQIVWAPAGVAHGVANRGAQRLVLLVGMAPPP
jgi:quercetin dioxygenase-like cupin family protein